MHLEYNKNLFDGCAENGLEGVFLELASGT